MVALMPPGEQGKHTKLPVLPLEDQALGCCSIEGRDSAVAVDPLALGCGAPPPATINSRGRI